MHTDKPKSAIRNPQSKIVIVGAGPAGTSLAIRLAKKDFGVTLIEREKFPRHKLCGEFISPECLTHFQELGVLDEMLNYGGDRISQTIFYSQDGKNVSIPSKWFNGNLQGALGLSRAEMDFRLMERAKYLGVKVLEEKQVVGLLFDKESVCGVEVKNPKGVKEEIWGNLTIDATGRAKVLSKMARRQISNFRFQISNKENKKLNNSVKTSKLKQLLHKTLNLKPKTQNPLVGFKAHLENVNLPKRRCEIYFFRGGYGGLSYVEDGVANHCFLIKTSVVKEYKGDVDKILKEVIFQNKRAKETMVGSKTVFDWLAVSVDGFGIKDLNPAENLFSVGDASAFIDPFTGSGMLMALEGAEILADVIYENYHQTEKIAEIYKSLHKLKFQKRLRVCSFMRRLSFAPNFAKLAINMLNMSKKSRELLVRLTRQTDIKKGI